jgi:hypothetical protein
MMEDQRLTLLPTSGQVSSLAKALLGQPYEPQTDIGKMAYIVGHALCPYPGALMGLMSTSLTRFAMPKHPDGWQGTPSTLQIELDEATPESIRKSRSWPITRRTPSELLRTAFALPPGSIGSGLRVRCVSRSGEQPDHTGE